MSRMNSDIGQRVGVYVDVSNISQNGGYGMKFEILRDFACRGNGEPMRLNAYVAFDPQRAATDLNYNQGQNRFHSFLRDIGYKVIIKEVKWYVDDDGIRYAKANADLDLAVDALSQSNNLEKVVLGTGDGDFVQVVRALQNKGCRVEVVAFENVSEDLKREADMFMSGYLVPNLLPMDQLQENRDWGKIGSRVRGVCYAHNPKNYGFIRFLKTIGPGLWRTDSKLEGSPFDIAFFHDSNLPKEINPADLPNRNIIFEFDLVKSLEEDKKYSASNIKLVGFRKK